MVLFPLLPMRLCAKVTLSDLPPQEAIVLYAKLCSTYAKIPSFKNRSWNWSTKPIGISFFKPTIGRTESKLYIPTNQLFELWNENSQTGTKIMIFWIESHEAEPSDWIKKGTKESKQRKFINVMRRIMSQKWDKWGLRFMARNKRQNLAQTRWQGEYAVRWVLR